MIDILMLGRIKLLLTAGGLVCAVCVLLLLRVVALSGKLEIERSDHDLTRLKLKAALTERDRWKLAAELEQRKIELLAGVAEACLDRERQAETDAAERDAIMNSAQPRERAPAESKGVVDDATREKAVDRLNRPL